MTTDRALLDFNLVWFKRGHRTFTRSRKWETTDNWMISATGEIIIDMRNLESNAKAWMTYRKDGKAIGYSDAMDLVHEEPMPRYSINPVGVAVMVLAVLGGAVALVTGEDQSSEYQLSIILGAVLLYLYGTRLLRNTYYDID